MIRIRRIRSQKVIRAKLVERHPDLVRTHVIALRILLVAMASRELSTERVDLRNGFTIFTTIFLLFLIDSSLAVCLTVATKFH